MSILSDALKKTDKLYHKKKRSKVPDIDIIETAPKKRGLKWWVIGLICLVVLGVIAYLSFELESKAPVKKKMAAPLKVVKAVKTVKAPVKKQVVAKKVAPKPVMQLIKKPSVAEVKAQLFAQSLGLLKSNKVNAAEKLLSRFSEKQNVFVPTILKLASALNIQKDYQATQKILLFGREYFPGNTSLLLPMASSEVALGGYKNALVILDAHSPVLQDHPDFYALKAMVYLRLKQYAQSKAIYTALSQAFPNKQNYALGLAVSYQGLKQNKMALYIYQQINNNALIGWSSLPFVKEQIVRLRS